MQTSVNQLEVADSLKTSEIKEAFNKLYPNLKLEFFNSPHGQGEGSPKSDMIQGDPLLGDLRANHTTGSISISPKMTVGSLEDAFESVYGLHVQVFRLSGKIWLETIGSDDWTLAEQNTHAEEMKPKQ